MFRPMRRASRAIPEEAAKHLLQQSRRGVLAVNGDNGYPFAIPVNYYYDQEHDKIYFHGAKSGQKVDALKQNDKVCFTVYGNEHFEPGDWAPYVQKTKAFHRIPPGHPAGKREVSPCFQLPIHLLDVLICPGLATANQFRNLCTTDEI